MRKKIVAGNWKMNTTVPEGVALAKEINAALTGRPVNCGVVVCVPATHLCPVADVIDDKLLGLGAENCSEHDKGAYTGEISAAMVSSTGAGYVIIGHSERRQYFGEDNAQLLSKVRQALANDLTPIFCVGEVLEQREDGSYNAVVRGQVEALFSLPAEEFAKIIVAYEPVWAIGTGKTATAEQAAEVCTSIRTTVRHLYGARIARSITIQYGGSMKPGNAAELLAQPDIDGGLIGGASLKPADFVEIINAANQD